MILKTSEIPIPEISTGKYLDKATLKNKRYIYMLKASSDEGDVFTAVVSVLKEL